MNLSLEQLTQILAKVRISSSLEEEILTAAESLFTPPEANEESTYEESCIFNKEQLGEKEIEEDNEELQHDLSEEQHAYESLIEQWFQVSTRLDKFHFCFYSVKSQSQQFNLFFFGDFYFSCVKMKMNIILLLLREWLHWKFNYT
jgi:hypothetical protein